ncbi:Solute carrier family 25 member 39 [Escovopsis weberi]|uniref:Solute carrier family 25 member 39 n=1 Tax=Escovopsis weberi TaxID=150374 RepID=A0A0M8MXR6_ESCWE|nr:Solute carrier family 25 member 39 [Escovopsis weberi]
MEDDEFMMTAAVNPVAAGPGSEAFPDITAGQKMVSAMSGSLLTSLLDVVRVRLQSQGTGPPPSAPPPSTAFRSADFAKFMRAAEPLPPGVVQELGVTACCREVFFAGNNAEYCFAGGRLEALTANASNNVAADCAVRETRRATYNSTIDGLRKIARNEGFTTLWRGLSPTLVMTIPANIIYFTGYDWLRYNSKSPFSGLSNDHAPLTAGALARTLAATAVGPIELVRTRMQAARGTSTTNHLLETFNGIREMVAIRGYTSLWRGLTLTLWRDVPFSGLYWWGYESIRSRITDYRQEQRGRGFSRDDSDVDRMRARRRSQSRDNHTETFVDSFVAGATSGALASTVTMPFDVGKTRTQIYHDVPSRAAGAGAGVAAAPEAQSMVRLLWHIMKTEGFPGLWRGWMPRTLKVAPACAIMISSYEVGKRVFTGVNERQRD